MDFHDPARPRTLTGRPCWLAAPLVALPYPMLDPLVDGGWSVSVMVYDGARDASHWAIVRVVEGGELARLLVNWRNDPEQTLVEHFNEVPPDASLTRSSAGRAQSIVDRTEQTAEELGL